MRSGGFTRFGRPGASWGMTIGLLGLAALTLSSAPSWVPPKLVGATLPQVSPKALGGGQVLLDVSIDENGGVASVDVLRQTPPFTDGAVAAVQGWRFDPARALARPAAGEPPPTKPTPVPSRVLVAFLYRPPALNPTTLGEMPTDSGTPSDEIVFPTNIITPGYPPRAFLGGTVLVEAKVDERGQVTSASVHQSAAGFDAAALAAARAWTFRPARIQGAAQATVAYLVFAFRQPITTATGR